MSASETPSHFSRVCLVSQNEPSNEDNVVLMPQTDDTGLSITSQMQQRANDKDEELRSNEASTGSDTFENHNADITSKTTVESMRRTSFLDLPFEIRCEIYELVFEQVINGTELLLRALSRTPFYCEDAYYSKPPFFYHMDQIERSNALCLLLTNKAVKRDVKIFLFAGRHVLFHQVSEARKVYLKVGAESFGLLTHVEISTGWVRSNHVGSVRKLEDVVTALHGIQSLTLGGAEKGERGQENEGELNRWTPAQIDIIRSIMGVNDELKAAYYSEQKSQLRLCSQHDTKRHHVSQDSHTETAHTDWTTGRGGALQRAMIDEDELHMRCYTRGGTIRIIGMEKLREMGLVNI